MRYLSEFLENILSAIRNQNGPTAPRYQRRSEKKMKGRKTTDGRYFGGRPGSAYNRIEREAAGKLTHA